MGGKARHYHRACGVKLKSKATTAAWREKLRATLGIGSSKAYNLTASNRQHEDIYWHNGVMKKKLKIRDATTDHVDSILNIQYVVWPILYSNKKEGVLESDIVESMDPEGEELSNTWSRVILTRKDKKGESKTLVAQDGDRIVGFGYAVKGTNKGEIRSLYVLPEYQNGRVGSMLMNHILD